MVVDIHSIVYHERYGNGEVIKVSDNKVYVAFGELQRIFPYPEALDKGYLTIKIGEADKKESAPDELVIPETKLSVPSSTRETTDTDFYDRLKKDIANESIVIKGVKQGGYSIQDTGNHRLVRVQELQHKYKCTCDREQTRRIFDKIKDNYTHCEGFNYKVMNKEEGQGYRVLNLSRYDDLISFILVVINEYFSSLDPVGLSPSAYNINDTREIILDVADNIRYKKIYEAINATVGTNYSGWMKAGWPDGKSEYPFWIWFPKLAETKDGKLVSAAFDCINTISDDWNEVIYEDLKDTPPEIDGSWRTSPVLIFAKEPKGGPYIFRGVYVRDTLKSRYKHHVVTRIGTRVKLIGKPAENIVILDDFRN